MFNHNQVNKEESPKQTDKVVGNPRRPLPTLSVCSKTYYLFKLLYKTIRRINIQIKTYTKFHVLEQLTQK